MRKHILLLNGPNLNLLGMRNKAVYGSTTLAEIVKNVNHLAGARDYDIVDKQSNHEGQLIDWIHEAIRNINAPFGMKTFGIILNAGGLTHTSVSLHDAVEIARDLGIPTVEVHLSDIHKRETFRHVSLLTSVCIAQISGKGPESYTDGLAKLIEHIKHIKAKK